MEYKTKFINLELSDDKPLEIIGATIGAFVGAVISYKFPVVVIVPTVFGALASILYHDFKVDPVAEILKSAGTTAFGTATGSILLGAKAGSYLDDVYTAGADFVTEHKLVEGAGLCYKHVSEYSDIAATKVREAMPFILKMFESTAEQDEENNPKPEETTGSTGSKAKVTDETMYGAMQSMVAEFKDTYQEYKELYNEVTSWVVGTE